MLESSSLFKWRLQTWEAPGHPVLIRQSFVFLNLADTDFRKKSHNKFAKELSMSVLYGQKKKACSAKVVTNVEQSGKCKHVTLEEVQLL